MSFLTLKRERRMLIAVPVYMSPGIKTTPPLVILFKSFISSITSLFLRFENAFNKFLFAFDSSSFKVLNSAFSQPFSSISSIIEVISCIFPCSEFMDSLANFSSSLNCFRFLMDMPTSKMDCIKSSFSFFESFIFPFVLDKPTLGIRIRLPA